MPAELAGKAAKGFFIRKEAKGHGTDQRIDGLLDRGSRVILFEDVTTTGGSALRPSTRLASINVRY